MTTPKFDEEIHAPVRLRICGLLSSVSQLDFATIREITGLADSVVSKHLARLEKAGYVVISKVPSGGRVRTWVSLTKSGRAAFDAHIAALQQIAPTSPRSNRSLLEPSDMDQAVSAEASGG